MTSARLAATEGRLFLGLDASTQRLKMLAVDNTLRVSHDSSIGFDADLPRFGTKDGVLRDDTTVTTPSSMLVAALDLLFGRLKEQNFPFDKVGAISGSGQQHGSVFWRKGAQTKLANLNPEQTLEAQLGSSFSFPNGPIWMDSSTTVQCRALEKAAGSAQRLADITGSRAFERFTASQIMKRAQQNTAQLSETERISLVSSMMCSLLLGDYASIDLSDGSGMNLLDINSQDWDDHLLEATAPGLRKLLGEAQPSHTVAGTISPYFVERYGFSPDCKIVLWSGDNPNSVAGLGIHDQGDVGISLGTSDTLFSITPAKDSKPGLEGHFFVSPVDPASHMAMLCYKNGSLTRQKIAAAVGDGTWETFNKLVGKTKPGNKGKIGFYFIEPEIVPHIAKPGVHRFDADGHAVDTFTKEEEARAVLEGQMLSLRLHSLNMGIKPKAVLVTGGASQNPAILKVIADVFGVPVKTADQPNSAPLGAALRAIQGFVSHEQKEFMPFELIASRLPANDVAATPSSDAHDVYTGMLDRYRELEEQIVAGEN
eukprot:m.191190 g.191190  ORF g.191190 m.191190 type:complete len:540 (-) comp10591_c2_seq9:3662-5281(-)